ncbi:MAG TPA: DUF2231 domain-containing protein [Gemmatimonadales bacterium]
MLPDPLHPAVVHFPIVLTFLLPLAAGFALWRIRRGGPVKRTWPLVILTAAALTLSSWVATQTGERDEDAAERIAGDAPVERHEEAAERFLFLTGGMLVLAGAGLLGGRAGGVLRFTAAAGALGLVVAGAQVGHSGGELVYRHGAAAAHADRSLGERDASPVELGRTDRDDDD